MTSCPFKRNEECKCVVVNYVSYVHVFQSIEREEPIEVDPAPTHAGLENGHTAATGNDVSVGIKVDCSHSSFKGNPTNFTHGSITQATSTVV